LLKLAKEVNKQRHAINTQKLQFDELARIFTKDGGVSTIANLDQHMHKFPQPLRNWSKQLIHNYISCMVKGAGNYVANKWQVNIYPMLERDILTKYPFGHTNTQVSINTFDKYFAHGGVFDKFFKEYMLPFVDVNQASWGWYHVYHSTLFQNADILHVFKSLDEFRSKMYSEKTKKMEVKFSLKPKNLDPKSAMLRFNASGQELIYQHGPLLSKQFFWPANSEDDEFINISFRDFNSNIEHVTFKGPWSWFLMLSSVKAHANKDEKYNIRVNTPHHHGDFVISADVNNPLQNLIDLSKLHFPKRIN